MKKTIKPFILLAFAGILAGCGENGSLDTPIQSNDTREITINFGSSRTTIEYEGSDFSHLVWVNGDKIAYTTDVSGDRFKIAEVTDNRFTATVPSGATASNTLVAVWPTAANEGLSLLEATAELKADFDQSVDNSFDGSLLPIYARVNIPENGNTVDARYETLGVVLRFAIRSYAEHETEIIKSLTLTANENLVGKYSIDPTDSEGWSFTGTSNTVKTTISGNNAMLEDEPYVYMVVARDIYTGVRLEIETDHAKYVTEEGSMDLTEPERTLFHINAPLGDTPEPAAPAYTAIRSVDELTGDGSYLLVADKSDSEFYVGYLESNNLTSAETLKKDENGNVNPNDVDDKLIWKIAPIADSDGLYSLYSVNVGKYVGTPLKYYTEYVSGRNYISYFVYNPVTGNTNAYWGISVEGDYVIIKNDYNAEGSTFIKYNPNSDSPFALITEALWDYDQCKEVKILKLNQ